MQNDEFNVEQRDGHIMVKAIIRSSLAIVSMISSSILIWMILRSKARSTCIYHRILLGMSVADIIFSLGSSHFNATAPSDNNYFVWNARVSQYVRSEKGCPESILFSSSHDTSFLHLFWLFSLSLLG